MKKFLSNINNNYLIAIITVIITVFVVLGCIPCFLFGYRDVPQGFLLGGLYSSIFYVFLGLADRSYTTKRKNNWAIAITIIRLSIFLIMFIGLAYVYYKTEIKIFSPFSIAGGYLFSTVSAVIASLIRKKCSNESN